MERVNRQGTDHTCQVLPSPLRRFKDLLMVPNCSRLQLRTGRRVSGDTTFNLVSGD